MEEDEEAYGALVASIEAAEARRAKPAAGPGSSATASAAAADGELCGLYDTLLQRFPHLEGFWIRRAHAEFRLSGSAERAVAVFKRALNTANLRDSLLLWTAYLRFLTHVAETRAPELAGEAYASISAKFERARRLVGGHFLAHEFWDLYLAHVDCAAQDGGGEAVALLVELLDNYSLHQFARFYALLVARLDASPDLAEFRALLPRELQDAAAALRADELPRLREVVRSRLKLKYELHQRRVHRLLPLERALVRPFFHPRRASAAPWCAYIEAEGAATDGSDAESSSAGASSAGAANAGAANVGVANAGAINARGAGRVQRDLYRRALIPLARDAAMWLAYIRHLRAHGASRGELRAAYQVPAETLGLVPVRLHYALWLEHDGDLAGAERQYDLAKQRVRLEHQLKHQPKHQRRQHQHRLADDPGERIHELHAQFLARTGRSDTPQREEPEVADAGTCVPSLESILALQNAS